MTNNQFIITVISILLPLAIHGLATTTTNTTAAIATDRDYRDGDRDYRDGDRDYRDRDRAYRNDKTPDVVVEGKVYCQTCKYYGGPWSVSGAEPSRAVGGPWSLSGAEPIRAARVRVICKNYKKRVSYYDTFVTDRNGYFYAELKDFKMNHLLLDHPLHACYVKLLSSPLSRCNDVSNLNNGISGAPLRFENKVLYGRGTYETVVYAAGPLAFRPSDCYPDKKATAEATDP